MYTIQSGSEGGYALLNNGSLVDTYETEAEAQATADRMNNREPLSTFEWLNR